VKWRDWRLAFYLAAAGLLWSVAVGLLLYFLPLGSSVSTSSSGAEVETRERIFTLSLSSLWPLIVPALLCALAAWAAARHHRTPLVIAAVLLAVFALLGALSIGVAYVPAVVLLIVSVLASSPVRQASGDGDSATGRG
jgi:uncharacterized membrane protein YhaH (DUF805 family)